MLNRCLPTVAEDESTTTLCAYPNCELAGRPCYTEQFAAELYWKPSKAELSMCEQVRRLESHTRALPKAAHMIWCVHGCMDADPRPRLHPLYRW